MLCYVTGPQNWILTSTIKALENSQAIYESAHELMEPIALSSNESSAKPVHLYQIVMI